MLAELDPCVHCGLCLQACPTFLATGDEADSPRGRIVLMRGWDRGDLPSDDPLLGYHLDRCLGCRACETACPAGVEYGHALERCRAELVDARPVPFLGRLVLRIMAEPLLRRPLLALARLVRPFARLATGTGRLGFSAGMLAATKRALPVDLPAAAGTAVSRDGPEVIVFDGCIMEGLFAHVNRATARVVARNGFRVVTERQQGCCGALHAHAGLIEEARELARQNTLAFLQHPEARIVVNSAGCGAMLKSYGSLLAGDPLAEAARNLAARTVDVSTLLADAGPQPGGALPLTVAHDPPCHLYHAQRITDAPRAVLEAVPDARICNHTDADQCCGSAGLYSLLQPDMSRQVLDRKLDHILASEPDVVVTGNPGCIMHIGAGLLARGSDLPVVHPVELLDASYRLAPRPSTDAEGREP